MPSKEIRLSEVRKLASLQVTEREAAGFFGVRVKWFKRLLAHDERVAAAWEEGRQLGLVGLRRSQFRLARRSATMSKWLGKQYLNQRDTVIVEASGPQGGPIETLNLEKLSAEEREKLRFMLLKARKDREEEDGEE